MPEAADGDVDAAYTALMIDSCVLAKEGVQRGLAAVKGFPSVFLGQKLDAHLIHGAE